MLKFIETEEEAELLWEFCTDSFGLTIASLLQAYPPELDICRFWMQITGDEITAALCSLNGEIVLSSNLRADYEELSEFIKTIGYTNILCRAMDVVSLNMFACGCGQVWRREPTAGEKADYSIPGTVAEFKAIFELLNIEGEFDEWFADITRRINSGTADMRYLERDGKIVSTASLLHINGEKALLGAVATAKEYRKQGLAKTLINSFENKIVYLRCLPALNSFYQKLGFKSVDVWAQIKQQNK